MNSPKHIRDRWRSTLLAPKTPPRTSMRRSPAPTSSMTVPMKKLMPTGTPFSEVAPLRKTRMPFIHVRTPSATGITSAAQSRTCWFPRPQACSQPRRQNQIEGQNARAYVAGLVLQDG
jgi:hypothetical protein